MSSKEKGAPADAALGANYHYALGREAYPSLSFITTCRICPDAVA